MGVTKQLEDTVFDMNVREVRKSLDDYGAGSKRTGVRPCKTKTSYLPVLCLRLFGLTLSRWGFGCRSILGSCNIRLLKLDVFIKDGKRLSDLLTQFLIIINPTFVSSGTKKYFAHELTRQSIPCYPFREACQSPCQLIRAEELGFWGKGLHRAIASAGLAALKIRYRCLEVRC